MQGVRGQLLVLAVGEQKGVFGLVEVWLPFCIPLQLCGSTCTCMGSSDDMIIIFTHMQPQTLYSCNLL